MHDLPKTMRLLFPIVGGNPRERFNSARNKSETEIRALAEHHTRPAVHPIVQLRFGAQQSHVHAAPRCVVPEKSVPTCFAQFVKRRNLRSDADHSAVSSACYFNRKPLALRARCAGKVGLRKRRRLLPQIDKLLRAFAIALRKRLAQTSSNEVGRLLSDP